MKRCPECVKLKTRCANCLRVFRELETERARQMTVLPSPDLPTKSIEHGDRLLGTGFRINEPFVPASSPAGEGWRR